MLAGGIAGLPAAPDASRGLRALRWLLRLAGALLALALLAGCAGLPQVADRPASSHRVAPADAPLSRWLAEVGVDADRQSGFRPLLASADALQARLDVIAQAQVGLDLQTYLLGDDATGHQLMRALRDAAARGVRVRLLVDDFYTRGMTDLLLGLAAQPNVELRLYNPFAAGRDSTLLRLAGLLGDFERLNRRMHNKLLVADGRVAIVGGRNLADAYFMRSDEGNFIDFDLACGGAIAAALGERFDRHWNSPFALPIQALADNGLDPAARRRSFEVLSRPGAAPLRRGHAVAAPGSAAGLLADRRPLVQGTVQLYFDAPEKTAGRLPEDHRPPVAGLLAEARQRVLIVSPYFLPSSAGLERMRQARARGVEVQVITNSLHSSDEPLVAVAYGHRRMALLQSGVRLFELASDRLHRQADLRDQLGGSIGRLHAKLGFIDDRWLLVGSMNLDPRSMTTNTELALAIDSPALTHEVQALLGADRGAGLYEVQLHADGRTLEWVGRDEAGEERLGEEPGPPWWERLRLWLLSLLVPDDLL